MKYTGKHTWPHPNSAYPISNGNLDALFALLFAAPQAAADEDSTSFLAGSTSRRVVSEDRTAGSIGGTPWLVVGIDIARCGMETLCGYREERTLADRATTNGVRPCMPLVRTERKRDIRATRVEAVDTRQLVVGV